MRGQGWGTCDPRKGRGRAQDANGVRRTMGVSPAGPGMREREVESVPDRTLRLQALQLKGSLPLLLAPELYLARPGELRDLPRLNESSCRYRCS